MEVGMLFMHEHYSAVIRDLMNEMRAVQHKSKLFMERLTAPSPLSTSHLMLMMDLKLTGSMRITEISERFSFTAGAATAMCDKLEAQGLVTRVRDKVDRRVVQVALTGAGERVVADLFASKTESELDEMLRIFREINGLMSVIAD